MGLCVDCPCASALGPHVSPKALREVQPNAPKGTGLADRFGASRLCDLFLLVVRYPLLKASSPCPDPKTRLTLAKLLSTQKSKGGSRRCHPPPPVCPSCPLSASRHYSVLGPSSKGAREWGWGSGLASGRPHWAAWVIRAEPRDLDCFGPVVGLSRVMV